MALNHAQPIREPLENDGWPAPVEPNALVRRTIVSPVAPRCTGRQELAYPRKYGR
jgi:hypothetical protein